MSNRLAARRHAEALLAVARERGEVERILHDFQTFCELTEAEPRLLEALILPLLPDEKKSQLLADIGERYGLSESLIAALEIIVSLRRGGIVCEVCEEYRNLAEEELGRAEAFVETALPLTEEQRKALADRLSKFVGKQVILHVEENPQLIAGLVIRIGDLRIDNSLRHGFAELSRRLAKG